MVYHDVQMPFPANIACWSQILRIQVIGFFCLFLKQKNGKKLLLLLYGFGVFVFYLQNLQNPTNTSLRIISTNTLLENRKRWVKIEQKR